MACRRGIPCSRIVCSVRVGAWARAASLTSPLLPAITRFSFPAVPLLRFCVAEEFFVTVSSIIIGRTMYCCLPITCEKKNKSNYLIFVVKNFYIQFFSYFLFVFTDSKLVISFATVTNVQTLKEP